MKMRVKPRDEIKDTDKWPGWDHGMGAYCGKVITVKELGYLGLDMPVGTVSYSSDAFYTWRSDWLTPVSKITVNLHRGRKW